MFLESKGNISFDSTLCILLLVASLQEIITPKASTQGAIASAPVF